MTRNLSTALCLTAFLCCSTLVFGADDGFQSIFDGKSLDGWDGNTSFWSVKEGAITGQTTKENPTKGNTFLIWKKGPVKDFELRLKFKIDGGNSGIQYRSKDHGNHVVGGYQADFDDAGGYTGILYEERGSRGIMGARGKKTVWSSDGEQTEAAGEATDKDILDSYKKKDWNEYTVIAKGNHLIHKVNGKVTVDVTDEDPKKSVAEGILALQLHAGPPMTVQFKDIQLKELK